MISPQNPTNSSFLKFLCSYGGRIIPRPSDGLLRYAGGHTRVLSVTRSISFSDLMKKLSEMCGDAVPALRCQLPGEELDVLVSVKSDEDLASVIDEYDRASSRSGKEIKIRAVLFTKSNNSSLMSSSSSGADLSPTKSSDGDSFRSTNPMMFPRSVLDSRCTQHAADRNWNRFRPCHVEARYRPSFLSSNYRQQ